MKKTYGNITVCIYETYDEMSEHAAAFFADEIKRAPGSVLGFATGSTPVGMYRALAGMNKQGEIDFSRVRATFNLDEYYPINKTDAQSYYYFMADNLFDHINIDRSVIHIPNGQAADPAAEAKSYEQQIAAAGGIDLQLLGIGANGHIGFNEPGECFISDTHVVTLTPSTIDANSRFFDSPEAVPKQALTMGIKTIMSAKKILLVCASESKAGILRDAVTGDITPKLPASILKLHADVTVMTDAAAGKYL